MGIDLRLTGAMVVIAYFAFAFIGQSLSPLARSRRRVRRLQQWYARSIALVLVFSSLVSVWVPTASLKDGVIQALTAAILPMAGVSLVYSALVLKRLYSRWRGASASRGAHRSSGAVPMSLAELQERDEGIRHGGDEERSERLANEIDALDEQFGDNPEEDQHEHRAAEKLYGAKAGKEATKGGVASAQARQRRA